MNIPNLITISSNLTVNIYRYGLTTTIQFMSRSYFDGDIYINSLN